MPRPRSDEAREKMLAATYELILRDGLRAVSIDQIARSSGVAKTTIYRHFPTKDELVVNAIDRATAIPPTPDTGTLRGDLVEFLGHVLPIFADPALRAATLDMLAATARDEELRQLYRQLVGYRARPLTTIYRRGVERGEIGADVDYFTAFDFIEGPLIVRSLLRPETFDDLDLEALVDHILPVLKGNSNR